MRFQLRLALNGCSLGACELRRSSTGSALLVPEIFHFEFCLDPENI